MFTSPDGDDYKKKKGTKLEVFHKIVYCTKGKNCFTFGNLELNDAGKVVAIKKDSPAIGKYMPSESAMEEPWKAFNKKYGSREQVFNSLSYCTKSGLKKSDLMINNKGKIVSRKKSMLAKERFLKKKALEVEIKIDEIANDIVKAQVANYIQKKVQFIEDSVEEEEVSDSPPEPILKESMNQSKN